jgi:thiosulfate dehydrogenase [quinone] large subunit
MLFYQKFALVFLRLTLGWIFLYAGISKFMTENWSAIGFLKGAKMFQGLFGFFADPSVLPYVNVINKWALLLLGLSLVLGIFIRISAPLGAALMVLYFLPRGLPKPDPTSFIVDSHWVYAAGLFVLAAFHAGRVWGVAGWCSKLPLCKKYPKFRALLD